MHTPETRQPLETMEEVVEVLRAALEKAKANITDNRRDVVIATRNHHEPIPGSGSKGTIVRDIQSLRDIQIPGVDRKDAVNNALERLFGERREIPSDAPERDMYTVACRFVAGSVATFDVQKIEHTNDALGSMVTAHERVLEEPKRPNIERINAAEIPNEFLRNIARMVTGPIYMVKTNPPVFFIGDFADLKLPLVGSNFTLNNLKTINETAEFHNKAAVERGEVPSEPKYCLGGATEIGREAALRAARLKPEVQKESRREIERIRGMIADPNKEPFVVWVAGSTDGEFISNIFHPSHPQEGAKFFLAEIPPSGAKLKNPDSDETPTQTALVAARQNVIDKIRGLSGKVTKAAA